jgi:hypothetical protein
MSEDALLNDEQKSTSEKSAASASSVKRKKKLTLYGGAGILLVALAVAGFFWYVFYAPRYGTIHYGICKVFAERQISFPSTMTVRDVEYYRNRLRVYVTHIDAAGQYRYDGFECAFNLPGFEIISARLNRDPLPQQNVNEFNKTINVILANPPDLEVPRPLRDSSLQDLWHGGGL